MDRARVKAVEGDIKQTYLRHERRRELLLPLGVGCVISSFGAASLCMLLPATQSSDASFLATLLGRIIDQESDDKLDLTISDAHITAVLALIALLAVGVVIIAYLKNDRDDFYTAFPNLDIAFSADETAHDERIRNACMAAGGFLLACCLASFIVFGILGQRYLGDGLGFLFGAVGVGIVLHGGMVAKRTEMFAYNYDALKHSNSYYLIANQQGANREAIIRVKRRILKTQAWMLAIITATALASVVLLMLPSLHTSFFWIPIAAGITAAFAIDRAAMSRSRRDLDPTSSNPKP